MTVAWLLLTLAGITLTVYLCRALRTLRRLQAWERHTAEGLAVANGCPLCHGPAHIGPEDCGRWAHPSSRGGPR